MDFLLAVPKAYLLLAYTAPVVFGFFCAYWAQETGRNAWLWFVLGALFPPITGIFLLLFNSERHRMKAVPTKHQDLGSLIATRKDVV
jgi:hypothetical protein